jgi:hypothetical protein
VTRTSDIGADEGGEAPCFAHLLDELEHAFDDVLTARLARSQGDCSVHLDASRHARKGQR